MSQPEAVSDGNGALIKWKTESETGNIGFNVYRVDKTGNSRVGKFVGGSALQFGPETVNGQAYSTFDPSGQPGSQYIVESFLKNGIRKSSDVVTANYVAKISFAGTRDKRKSLTQGSDPSILISGTPTLSKALQDDIANHSLAQNLTQQRTVVAQPGVKIGIRQPGFYRVTSAQLQAAGFDISSDSTKWQLYTDGNEQSIIVGPNASYIEFYGKAIDTVESDTRMYYLVAGGAAGRRISTFALRPSFRAVAASSYGQDLTTSQRDNYVVDVLNGNASNYFGDAVFQGSTTTENFNVAAIDKTSISAEVVVRLQGYAFISHSVNVSLNGQPIGQATGNNQDIYSLDVTIPTSGLVEGTNTLSLSTNLPAEFSFFYSVEVIYNRVPLASQNQLIFTTTGDFSTQLQGFTSGNIRVFDVTDDGNPVQMTGLITAQDGGTFDTNLPPYKDKLMCGVEDSGLLSPASIGPNNPSTLATPGHNANLIIVSYKDFLTQANAWADYRRGQGFSVEVVDVDDIYDEFNYGVLSANSLRDFFNYAKTNWQTPPSYILLIGDGTYDPRGFEGEGFWDLIPAMLVDTVQIETASDDAFVDFNNDGLGEIPIGRIPARNPSMASTVFTKTMTFEQLSTTQNLSRGVLFAYQPPKGYDFMASSQGLRDQLPAGTTSIMVGQCDPNFPTFPCDPNAHTTLLTEVNNGRYLVNFAGHGSTGVWISTSFFSLLDVPSMTNASAPSIFTMLTCLNGYFQNAGNSSFAEDLVNAPNGGAAAAWASSGTTTPDIQELMARRFYSQIGSGNIPRLGDLILDAKTQLPFGRDVRLSWVLLGDPMLKTR
jgi:hypothetical protein